MDSAEIGANGVAMATGNGRGKVRLLTRQNLDGRTKARKRFDAVVTGIAADLGGEDRLSTVEKHLVEAFAGITVVVHDINARLLLGQEIDIGEAATAVSSLVRLAHRLGARHREESWLGQAWKQIDGEQAGKPVSPRRPGRPAKSERLEPVP
jgi:hypothetical protein